MITIWHNPRCSKSRQALKLLEDAGVEIGARRYLEDTPTASEIEAVLKKLGITPDALLRKGEKVFKELGLKSQTDPTALLAAMEHSLWLGTMDQVFRQTVRNRSLTGLRGSIRHGAHRATD